MSEMMGVTSRETAENLRGGESEQIAKDGGESLCSVSARCYRTPEKNRIVAALQADSSLLVVSGPGMGKTALARFVADELRTLGFPVALVTPTTAKQVLVDLAEQLGLGISRLDGKIQSATQLQTAITEFVQRHPAFLIFDDAHRLAASLRAWLEQLLAQGQRLLLFATHPPRRDIFLKLPRIELKPLDPSPIRELMEQAAVELGLNFTPGQFAGLQERCGGNPMLARRVVREEHLGLDDTAPDHTQWIDGTPLLIAGLMIFTVLRFIGRGIHSTDLYLIGGVLTVAVGVMRLLVLSLPRKSERMGK
jgi:hypothetical protein